MAILDCDAASVIGMVEDGALPWAFNVSSQQSNRREVRILVHCLACLQAGKMAENRALDFSAVIKVIFPMAHEVRPGVIAKLSATTVYRRLNIKNSHLLELLSAGLFKAIAGTKCRPGPGGSPEVEFASVVEFLKQRRIV